MNKISTLFISLILLFNLTTTEAESDSMQYESEQNKSAPSEFEQVQFTQAELEQMLAPIALYPDSVLTHILIASTYPLEIIQANRWLTKNQNLEAADALTAVENEEWDPSVKALVAFPRILERLSDDLDWTQKLGDAFLQSEERVLASIQSLRQKADQAGNLDKMENMEISREDKHIIIQPREREVIYVPYYDTRVVYGHWHWDDYQPIYWDWSWHQHHHHHGYHYTPHYGVFSYHPRSYVSTHYYWSAFNWHNHHVIVIDHRYSNARVYRHRSHIIADSNARHWTHNPTHRRGVAYRSEPVRQRYYSTRPSATETRVIRNNERNIVNTRHTSTARDNTTRVINNNRRDGLEKPALNKPFRETDNRMVNDGITQSRENIELTTNDRAQVSRQERLRQQLNNNANQQNNTQVNVFNRNINTQNDANNNQVRNFRNNATQSGSQPRRTENSNSEQRNRSSDQNSQQNQILQQPQNREIFVAPAPQADENKPRAESKPRSQTSETKRERKATKPDSNGRSPSRRTSDKRSRTY